MKTFVKVASTEREREGLKNAWRFLKALHSTGFVPEPISLSGDSLTMEYVEAKKITNMNLAFKRCDFLLDVLVARGIQHGDLEKCNVVFRKNSPVILDWDEAVYVEEGKKPKRPEPDAYWLSQTLSETLRSDNDATVS